MIKRLIIILWALTLGYLATQLLGATHILSAFMDGKNLVPAIDLLYFAFVLFFTWFFWFIMPQNLSKSLEVLGIVLPLGVLVFLLV